MKEEVVSEWLLAFKANPDKEFDNILRRNLNVGAIGRLSTSEILSYAFKDSEQELLQQLDSQFEHFFKKVCNGYIPAQLSYLRWAEALSEFFIAIDVLKLKKSISLLTINQHSFRLTFRKFYHSPVLDPEYSYLRTLALNQNDDSLFSTWFALCAMQELIPAHYASLGFLGLRKLPSSQSNEEPPKAIYSALILYAEAIQKLSGENSKNKEEMFLSEFRFIKSLYPKFKKDKWALNFRENDVMSFYTARNWIEKDLGKISDNKQSKSNNKFTQVKVLRSPMPNNTNKVIEALNGLSIQSCDSIVSFFNDHKQYYLSTGESKYLSKAYTNIAVKSNYPQLKEALLNDAFYLTHQYDPYVWTNLAIQKARSEKIDMAIGLLFFAKKKFPYNEWVRNILAIFLLKEKRSKEAEFVFQQTISQTKHSEYAYIQLLKMLMNGKRTQEAEDVVNRALKDFPDNEYFKGILGSILIRQSTTEKLEKAERLYKAIKKKKKIDNVSEVGLLIIEMKTSRGNVSETLKEKAKNIAKQINAIEVKSAINQVVNNEANLLEIENALTSNIIKEASKTIFSNSQDSIDVLEDFFEIEPLDLGNNLMLVNANTLVDSIVTNAKLGRSPNVFSKNTINFYSECGKVELYLYATMNIDSKYRGETLRLAESLCNKHPNNPAALLQKGRVLLNLSEQSAAELFEKQVRVFNNSPAFQVGLLRAKNQHTNSDWNELLRRFPTYETAIRLSQTLNEFKKSGNWDDELVKKLKNRIDRCSTEKSPSEHKNKYEGWMYDVLQKELFDTIPLVGQARNELAPPHQSGLPSDKMYNLWSVAEEFLELGMN